MTDNLDLWKLLAGLGIFLFGMFLLEDSIKALSGKAFRRVISHYTKGRTAFHRQRLFWSRRSCRAVPPFRSWSWPLSAPGS